MTHPKFRAWVTDGGPNNSFVKLEIAAENVTEISGSIRIFGR